MKPIERLIRLGLRSWSSLFVGLNNGWVTRKDVIDYAVNFLIEGNANNNENIKLLAGAENYDDNEFQELLIDLFENNNKINEAVLLDQWRLVHLLNLAESDIDDQTKIDKLQDIYAKFNYPEDMISCSIYSQNDADPLDVMAKVINELRLRFEA